MKNDITNLNAAAQCGQKVPEQNGPWAHLAATSSEDQFLDKRILLNEDMRFTAIATVSSAAGLFVSVSVAAPTSVQSISLSAISRKADCTPGQSKGGGMGPDRGLRSNASNKRTSASSIARQNAL
jgi:poly(3-hydroxybutyrate) depolymerase